MESGLEGRNNSRCGYEVRSSRCLNGVRPRKPEQFTTDLETKVLNPVVSMESGLEGRNNDNLSFGFHRCS